jgi:hypothetical protein
MQIIKISPHSFVDLITNSSSELFVCDTDKSIQLVKEIMVSLLTKYYLESLDSLAQDITFLGQDYFILYFGLKYRINDKDKYSPKNTQDIKRLVREIYNGENGEEKIKDFIFHFSQEKIFHVLKSEYNFDSIGFFYNKKDSFHLKCHENSMYLHKYVRTKLKKMGIKSRHVFHSNGRYIRKPNKSYLKHSNTIYRSCNKYGFKLLDQKVNYMFSKYNIDKEEHDDLLGYAWYGIDLKEGDIIIESATDNTIPYEIWEEINEVFNAKNYHLG